MFRKTCSQISTVSGSVAFHNCLVLSRVSCAAVSARNKLSRWWSNHGTISRIIRDWWAYYKLPIVRQHTHWFSPQHSSTLSPEVSVVMSACCAVLGFIRDCLAVSLPGFSNSPSNILSKRRLSCASVFLFHINRDTHSSLGPPDFEVCTRFPDCY